MVTVALIGADGAGKTTIGRRIEKEGTLRVKYLYMGVNPEASNRMLPTTWLILKVKRLLGRETHAGGPPDPSRLEARPRGVVRRALRGIKSCLRTVNQLGEEWFRQLLAWCYECRGYVVLFDRHFYSDYYAHDIAGDSAGRTLARRIHGFALRRLYPQPDLVVLLDAPADVLFERKGEGSVELVERRRQEYLQVCEQVPQAAIVDATQPLDAVLREVIDVIREFHADRDKD